MAEVSVGACGLENLPNTFAEQPCTRHSTVTTSSAFVSAWMYVALCLSVCLFKMHLKFFNQGRNPLIGTGGERLAPHNDIITKTRRNASKYNVVGSQTLTPTEIYSFSLQRTRKGSKAYQDTGFPGSLQTQVHVRCIEGSMS